MTDTIPTVAVVDTTLNQIANLILLAPDANWICPAGFATIPGAGHGIGDNYTIGGS